jgi:hypothetical protein
MTTIVTRIQNDVKMVIAFTILSKDYPNIFVGSSKYQLSYCNDDWNSVKISFDVDTEEVIDVSTLKTSILKIILVDYL